MKQFAILLSLLLLAAGSLQAQKQMTRNGHIWFFSSTPVEDIEAHNYQATSIIDPESGEMAFVVLMRGFQFEKALMQEHFNEKYVHSDDYPKATFNGQITNLETVNFTTDGSYEAEVSGELTIHGVTKEITTTGTITIEDGVVKASATFPITLADHNIEIPSMVEDKIAKVVDAHVDMSYEPMNR